MRGSRTSLNNQAGSGSGSSIKSTKSQGEKKVRIKDGQNLMSISINTLRPRQNGRHFPDDILKCIFLNENVWISLTISLKCVRKVRINNIPSLVQIIAWHRPGDKPLSEPMMVSLLTHICVTRPQWVDNRSSATPPLPHTEAHTERFKFAETVNSP